MGYAVEAHSGGDQTEGRDGMSRLWLVTYELRTTFTRIIQAETEKEADKKAEEAIVADEQIVDMIAIEGALT